MRGSAGGPYSGSLYSYPTNPKEVDEENSLDDPEGKDIPVETSAFDRVDLDISDLGDGLEAIDIFNLAEVLLNPFKMLFAFISCALFLRRMGFCSLFGDKAIYI
jgi:hypothetical protein